MDMLKVLIIDDEEIVRMGIRTLIRWEEEGYAICGEGADGREGLEKLTDIWPDVVLVDIKMPGLSGLELIKAAREKGFSGEFIILTGFSEFQYAKTAISYGVVEYLLKPIDEDELLTILRKIRADKQKEQEEHSYHSSNEDKARKELMSRILLRLDSRESLAGQMELYRMDYSDKILCVAVLGSKDFAVGNENQAFMGMVEEFLKDKSLYVEQVLMDNGVVIVQEGMDYRSWTQLLGERNERVRRRMGQMLDIAVGHNVSNWYDLTHSYEFALFLMEHSFLFGDRRVLSMDAIEEDENLAENPSVDYFCMLIEVGDMDGIENCVKRAHQFYLKSMMKELDIRIQVMYNLMQVRTWAEKKYELTQPVSAELMEKLNGAKRLDSLMGLYCQILQDLCIRVGSCGSGTVIKRMYYYMEKNYDKDLKLETLAKMFHYNSNYLGKIFRKEIGDSFNNILDTIRITNAKRLLAETDLKVYQIAERVGYSNIDYFHLKFQKYVGISPTEWKKSLRGG